MGLKKQTTQNRHKQMRRDAKQLAGILNKPWKEVYKVMKKGE